MTELSLNPILIEENSALQDHLGYRLTGWDTGRAQLELPLIPQLMNRAGIPHGGIYATLLDTAMGYAGCYTGDPNHKALALTLSMTVNFLSRPKGTLLIAHANQTGGGAKTFFAEGYIVDETGEMIARASGAFKLRQSHKEA